MYQTRCSRAPNAGHADCTLSAVNVHDSVLHVARGSLGRLQNRLACSSDWQGSTAQLAHLLSLANAPSQHGIDAWVANQCTCQLRAARGTLLLVLVDPLPEALQAEIVLAWRRHRPITEPQTDAALQMVQVLFVVFCLHGSEQLCTRETRWRGKLECLHSRKDALQL